MQYVFFCEACELHKKKKCSSWRCPKTLFIDVEHLFKIHRSHSSAFAHCDLILHEKNKISFIELKSPDRYTKKDGGLITLFELENFSNRKLRKLGIKKEKAFSPENAVNKIKCTMDLYYSQNPEARELDPTYYYFISDKFFDYWNEKKVELNFPMLKQLLFQTLFSTYLIDGPLNNQGKICPLIVDICSRADDYFERKCL